MMLKLAGIYWLEQLKLGTGDKKAKLRLLGLLAVGIYVFVMVYSFANTMAAQLSEQGSLARMAELFMTAASALVILSTLFSARDILFSYRDREMLTAMPIKRGTLVGSRVLILLIYESVFTLMLMLPMFVAFGRHVEITPYFILCAVVGCLFSACAPAVVGAVVGTGLSALLSGFKGAKVLRYVVLAVFALAIMAVSMSTGFTAGGGQLSEAALARLDDVMASVRSFFPTVRLFSDGLTGEPLKLAAFVVVSAALAALLVLFASKLMPFVLARSDAGGAAKGYRPEKTRSVFSALFNREARLYFGSPMYLFNTGFSLLIMLIGAVAVAVFRRKILDSRMMLEGGRFLWSMLPYLLALFISMCPITAVTISIEGPRFWIIRSMPVSAKKVLAAKLLLALLVEAAVIVVSVTVLQLALPMDALSRAMLYVLPLVYCLFMSLMGLLFNLRMPKLEWKTEAAVVKQSASVTVTMIVGMSVTLIPMIVSMALGPIGAPVVAGALLIASVILLIWLFKGGVRRFNQI
ncbi:MAG: hypothetical protein K6F67_02495 [Oscillospiraceae bacterium]|nr:hypothetical protein [Oscillospiraceae bacterium]